MTREAQAKRAALIARAKSKFHARRLQQQQQASRRPLSRPPRWERLDEVRCWLDSLE